VVGVGRYAEIIIAARLKLVATAKANLFCVIVKARLEVAGLRSNARIKPIRSNWRTNRFWVTAKIGATCRRVRQSAQTQHSSWESAGRIGTVVLLVRSHVVWAKL
jgi:hypothetical protein